MDTEHLLEWYRQNKRDLPWRKRHDAYAVLVSEMMLQQTTVETVLGYYEPFLEKFPDVYALAAADEETVLNAWKGLGYYSRARNLQRTAVMIEQTCGGVFPDTYTRWRKLPGVGPYIAGAVMSIALGIPQAAVDGNVLRVFARMDASREDISLPQTRKAVEARVQKLMPAGAAGDFTQALMELGALVCRPLSPDCANCPVAGDCKAYRQGITGEIPFRKQRDKPQTAALWVAVVLTPESVLMEYRSADTLLARMWGLPAAEKQDGRTAEVLLGGKYGIALAAGQSAGHAVHVFTHRRWEMDIMRYSLEHEIEAGALEWVKFSQLETKPIPEAFAKVLRTIGKGVKK